MKNNNLNNFFISIIPSIQKNNNKSKIIRIINILNISIINLFN